MLRLFSAGVQAPPKGARVVYIDGETTNGSYESNLRWCAQLPLVQQTSVRCPSVRVRAGAWDMFHAGHVAILKQAREFGDYLIAGVHSDEVVNAQRGLNMPIMNLNERVLSVLGCAYVNDVLIDAPLKITRWVLVCDVISSCVHGNIEIPRIKL